MYAIYLLNKTDHDLSLRIEMHKSDVWQNFSCIIIKKNQPFTLCKCCHKVWKKDIFAKHQQKLHGVTVLDLPILTSLTRNNSFKAFAIIIFWIIFFLSIHTAMSMVLIGSKMNSKSHSELAETLLYLVLHVLFKFKDNSSKKYPRVEDSCYPKEINHNIH